MASETREEAEERWFRGTDEPDAPEPAQIEMMDTAELLRDALRLAAIATASTNLRPMVDMARELAQRIDGPPASTTPQQEPEGESVRCSCEWAHPVDGSVRLDCPAELDPACLVHSVQQDPKRDPREAVIREIVNLVIEYEMVWYGEGMPPVWLARLDAADPLRKLLPEVVEVLEEARSPGSRSSHVNAIVRMARRWEKRRDELLTRLKTFTESE